MRNENTAQKILDAALGLFAKKGYDAVSVDEIAKAVGIKAPSIYNHFGSKQEILDALVREVLERYEEHSVFAGTDWDDPTFLKTVGDITPDTALQLILKHLRYILHDPQIRKSRKMLTVEQFRNTELKALQTKQNYTDVMRYFTGLIAYLIRCGRLTDNDAEVMAAQLCLPISVWINLCDREPEREEAVMGLLERHVRQFFAVYGKAPVLPSLQA